MRGPLADVLVRRIPDTTVEKLKARAARHNRSLEAEIRTILADAASEPDAGAAIARIDAFRERLAGLGKTFSDSTLDVRDDRDR